MFRGGASRQTAYALWGPCSSPGSLCLGTKAVSGVRDYPRSTGCSDLKNTPGLLEDGAGTYADICGSG